MAKKTKTLKGKRKNPSWRKSVKHLKKVRRRLGIEDWNAPSKSKQQWKASTRRPMKHNTGRKPPKRNNPIKLKRVTKSSGWLKADAVRFVKKGRSVQVFVRRAKRRKSR